jgi:hypothetical protein
MNTRTNRHGGKRKGAGTIRRNFHFSLQEARRIRGLYKIKRGLTPNLTEEQMILSLVDAEWERIDQVYQQAAELAAEGEGGAYLL